MKHWTEVWTRYYYNNAAMNTKSHTATPRQPAWAGKHGEGMNTPPPRTMPSHAF